MAKGSGSNRYSAVESLLGSRVESRREMGERIVRTQFEMMNLNLKRAASEGRIAPKIRKQINEIFRSEGGALGGLQGNKNFYRNRNKMMDKIEKILIDNKVKLK